MEKKTSKPKSMPRGKLSEIRKEPGKSNAYKYSGVKKFAGPSHTYPIGDEAHAKNALSRAHFASNPAEIKKKVYSAYPGLKKRNEARTKGKK